MSELQTYSNVKTIVAARLCRVYNALTDQKGMQLHYVGYNPVNGEDHHFLLRRNYTNELIDKYSEVDIQYRVWQWAQEYGQGRSPNDEYTVYWDGIYINKTGRK